MRQEVRDADRPVRSGGKFAVAWSASLQCRTGSDSERRTVILGSSERRVLEHDLVPPTQFDRVVAPELPEVTVVEPNRARGDGAVRT